MIAALAAGLAAGLVHVVSGPDHMAAVGPLALEGRRRAWVTGVRWGLGHMASVALLGVLALALRGLLPIERLSGAGERVVGVTLVAIGLWALRRALVTRVHVHAHAHDGVRHVHIHVHDRAHAHDVKGDGAPPEHAHGHAAFAVGVLHGLAGTSHLFGILPALAMPSVAATAAYLGGFGAGTIVAMGLFAAVIGRVAMRFTAAGPRLYRALAGTAAVAAIAVGVFWLVA